MHSILFFHGPAREITDLRPLLLHWQYCYYTGFVLHCIKIVWVHKQPKHFDHEQTWQRWDWVSQLNRITSMCMGENKRLRRNPRKPVLPVKVLYSVQSIWGVIQYQPFIPFWIFSILSLILLQKNAEEKLDEGSMVVNTAGCKVISCEMQIQKRRRIPYLSRWSTRSQCVLCGRGALCVREWKV